ncbi:LLM class flavin-dependent oxidoreductase [Frankia gtarii]|uniref:LLM class flavin-dependent oxidoreductase n=1 Tax=Frankia gtarii TaxID=2950102 RepID=UPI0021C0A87E|nr:LLM class flavin-dependent oxidoreductase [Frankia gtarii]
MTATAPGAPTPTAQRPFKLGFLTHVNGPGQDARTVYRELLDFFQAADDLGYDGGWVAQHHLRRDYGRLPSPWVFLAAAAQRAPHLRLGTAVTTLTLEDPLRLAEDVSVLDALSDGRAEFGVGSAGGSYDSFRAFGRVVKDRREVYDDHLARLRAALDGQPLTDAPGAPTLQPHAPGLADRLWQAVGNGERAADAGRIGDGLLLGTHLLDPETAQKPIIEAYLAGWRQTHDPAGPEQPRTGLVRWVFPADDRAAARADLGPALVVQREMHRETYTELGATELLELNAEQLLDYLHVHCGTVDEVVASLRADPALFGYADWFVPIVSHELSDVDADIRRLEIVATEIAPAFGWSPARETGRVAEFPDVSVAAVDDGGRRIPAGVRR